MEDRNYIVNLMKSKNVSIDEFNWDNLFCPPIMSYFTIQDISNLEKIATSVKYAANPRKKFKEIDDIMRSRGFVKLASGTNRVCYRCVENDSFVAKIAYDKVGMRDNPAEFVNQNYIKPFCTKIFEIAGNGVIAFAERVKPITSREEYLSVAKHVFSLINDWLIGEYVLDDIGSKYFMNMAVRQGFGVVILDFPYLYPLDGNKLFCTKPDNNNESGKCDGEIDYDDGFNFLVCKKCGAMYRARELAKDVRDEKIIIRKRENNIKMRFKLTGGTFNANEYVGDDTIMAKTTKESKKVSSVQTNPEFGFTVKVSGGSKGSTRITIPDGNPGDYTEYEVKEDGTKVPMFKFVNYKLVEDYSEDIIEDVEDIEEDVIEDFIRECVEDIIEDVEDDKDEEKIEETEEYNVDYYKNIKSLSDSLLKDANKVLDDKDISGIVKLNVKKRVVATILDLIKSFRSAMSVNDLKKLCNLLFYDDDKVLNVMLTTGETEEGNTCIYADIVDNLNGYMHTDNIAYVEFDDAPKEDTSDDDSTGSNIIKDCTYFVGAKKNLADIIRGKSDQDVIVLYDNNNDYLTVGDGNILAICKIDDMPVAESMFVGKDAYNSLVSNIGDMFDVDEAKNASKESKNK